MSAVAIEVVGPSGLGHELLSEWAPWAKDHNPNKHSWSVRPRIDRAHDGEWPESVSIVDKIIAAHRLSSHSDWRVIGHYYLGSKEIWEISRRLSWPESRVRVRLAAICGLIEREYRDYKGLTSSAMYG